MATLSTEGRIDGDGRVRIPTELLAGLDAEAGDEVLLRLRDGAVVVRPLVSREEFVETMEGCITEETALEDAPDIDPLELKEMWGPGVREE